MALVVLDPAPGHEVLIARVIGPACALAEPPLTIAEYRFICGCKQPGVERPQFLIDRLFGAPAQKDRQSYFSSLNLSFIRKSCAGKRGRGQRGGPLLRR